MYTPSSSCPPHPYFITFLFFSPFPRLLFFLFFKKKNLFFLRYFSFVLEWGGYKYRLNQSTNKIYLLKTFSQFKTSSQTGKLQKNVECICTTMQCFSMLSEHVVFRFQDVVFCQLMLYLLTFNKHL